MQTTYVAPCKVVCVTLNFFISISRGWHWSKSWLQQPPHRSIRMQFGQINTLGSELWFKGTVIFSGVHPAGMAWGMYSKVELSVVLLFLLFLSLIGPSNDIKQKRLNILRKVKLDIWPQAIAHTLF